jgi:hypothetical protein
VLGVSLWVVVAAGSQLEPFHVCVMLETVFQTVLSGFGEQFCVFVHLLCELFQVPPTEAHSSAAVSKHCVPFQLKPVAHPQT